MSKNKGFKELQKQLKKMEKGAKELQQTSQVPFDDLFTLSFMRKNTEYDTMDQLIEAGGFKVETTEDFEQIPDEDFDKHIVAHTRFNSWQEMLDTATEAYITKKLGF